MRWYEWLVVISSRIVNHEGFFPLGILSIRGEICFQSKKFELSKEVNCSRKSNLWCRSCVLKVGYLECDFKIDSIDTKPSERT